METTIKRTVKGSIMEDIFDYSEVLSVRYYYNLTLKEDEEFNPDKDYQYTITVRHPEGTKGGNLFDTEVRTFKNKQKHGNTNKTSH